VALKDLIWSGLSARASRQILAEISAGGGGGGGGAFGGTKIVTSSTRQVSAVSGGQSVAFNGWTSSNYVNAHPGPAVTIDNPNFNWTPTLAGWYQISWNLLIEFSAAAPLSVRFENVGYYDSYGLTMDLPIFGNDVGSGNGRQGPGYQGRMTTNVFYTEDAATVGGSGIKPFMYWLGTPTLSRLFLTAEIAKLG
jgi:hypothetical protein